MEMAQPPRFRFRLGTVLFVVAVLALLWVVVTQQVQIGRQQVQIQQLRQQADTEAIARTKLTSIIREQRDHIERQAIERKTR
jgi:type II secretory pathway component PulK